LYNTPKIIQLQRNMVKMDRELYFSLLMDINVFGTLV